MSLSFSLSPDEHRALAAILRRHKEDGLVVRRANLGRIPGEFDGFSRVNSNQSIDDTVIKEHPYRR